MRACYPHLKENQGSVINFASGSGLNGHAHPNLLCAAKEAIRGISRVAANEWATDNINVNIISPLAATEGVKRYLEAFPEQAEKLLDKTPLHRFGDPETDIGRVALLLASDNASYMTGQTLMVDGGSIMLR